MFEISTFSRCTKEIYNSSWAKIFPRAHPRESTLKIPRVHGQTPLHGISENSRKPCGLQRYCPPPASTAVWSEEGLILKNSKTWHLSHRTRPLHRRSTGLEENLTGTAWKTLWWANTSHQSESCKDRDYQQAQRKRPEELLPGDPGEKSSSRPFLKCAHVGFGTITEHETRNPQKRPVAIIFWLSSTNIQKSGSGAQ